MEYHPDKRDEILAERIKVELRRKHLSPRQSAETVNTQSLPSDIDIRMEEYRKVKKELLKIRDKYLESEENRKRMEERRKGHDELTKKWNEFLDSPENQKKYGFRTEIENGVRSIYYNGDFNVLEEAVFGPVTYEYGYEPNPERNMRLLMIDNHLFTRLPNTDRDCAVNIRIGTRVTEEPNFAIVTETGTVLTRLSLVDPAYYPEEESYRYSIDMKGLTVLNGYVRINFDNMIAEWNKLHPEKQLDEGIPIPNYRFLGSPAYLQSKQINQS